MSNKTEINNGTAVGKKLGSDTTRSNFGSWGWSMIALCAICYFISGCLNTDGLNIFATAINGLRGWDTATILSFSTYGGWVAIIFSFLFGHVIVKKGPKLIMVITLLVTAGSVFIYGHTSNLAVFGIAVGVTSICGTGYALTAANALQSNWFPKKKALALGWSTMGFPLCSVIFPAASTFLIGKVGVEGMFTALAIFVLAVGIISIFWAKNYPEDVGRAPDNVSMTLEEIAASKKAMQDYVSPWTIKRLVKEKRTWLIGISLGLLWMVTVAIVSQIIPRLMSVGFERTEAIGMMAVVGLFGLFGSYAWGWIDQKIGTRKACLIYAVWYVLALVCLIFMSNNFVAYLGIFMVGISVGGICNLIPSMIGTIFGRHDFAAASRLISPVTRAIMVCAYFYNAQSLRLTGSLTAGYIGLVVVCVISFALIYFIKPFKDGTKREEKPAMATPAAAT